MSESGHGDVRAVQAALTELSPRELEVVALLGQGYGLSEIAARMSISGRTIETHLVRLRAKLGVKSNRELTRAAIQFLHPVEPRRIAFPPFPEEGFWNGLFHRPSVRQ